MEEYRYFVSGTAPVLFPTHLFFGLLWVGEGDAVQLPRRYPFRGDWGEPISTHLLDRETFPAPFLLDMVWLSLTERRFYSVYERLPQEELESLLAETDDQTGEPLYSHLVVGMAPYGGAALWAYGTRKCSLVRWLRGEPVRVAMAEFLPANPDIRLEDYCADSLGAVPEASENFELNGLPPQDLYEKYMQQFHYRYQIRFGKWNGKKDRWEEYAEEEVVPVLDSLEELLYDGTHDKLNDGRLLAFHEAGKPWKLAVKWHVRKWEYLAFFWFADAEIRAAFDRFYGSHPETKSDFLLRIDPERNRYEVSMFRPGLQEPFVLPETAFDVLVFRNQFECFRSDNYSQEPDAWLW